MAVGKNKRLSKGKKGLKKRAVDPFSRKDWFEVKAPAFFATRNVGKTFVNRSSGLKSAEDGIRRRVFEVNLGDINKDDENSFRKIKLVTEDVQGKNALTNFYGLEFTSDKLRSMVRKWQSLIDAHIDIRTSDDYLLRLFTIAFTKRRANQTKKTTYAKASQIRAIRQQIFNVITRETANSSLKELVHKLVPEHLGREIENATAGIYPLQNVYVRKVKVLKAPKMDINRLSDLHGEAISRDGAKAGTDFVEPEAQDLV